MSEFTDPLAGARRRLRRHALRPAAYVAAPVAAILFQVYTPLFLQYLSFLELPLLVTVYLSLLRRDPVQGVLIGAAIGLLQDAFSSNPLGMFGIVKTLVGFFAASLSQRVDSENVLLRFVIGLSFFLFHQFLYWVLIRALLAQQLPFDPVQTAVLAVLNAAVAVPLFSLLDRL